MVDSTIENFVCWPHPYKPDFVILANLQPSKTFSTNGFVFIPYLNSETEKIKPEYFKILSETEMKFPYSTFINPSIELIAQTKRKEYIENVKKIKEQIQLGNIYEINYCIEFFANGVEIEPLEIFKKLHQLSKAPYSYLVKLGNNFIIGASPELFLKKEGLKLSTKPIKGTAKRGLTLIEDEVLKTNLFTSIKERTENVMAVDVARNDLSKIAKKGTVSVNKLFNIETFETVHQMVSTVSCIVKPDTSFKEIIEATFPMASMTGAPKISAMNLIDELEVFKRGPYSGAIGLINDKGDFTIAVNIRSIFYNQITKKLSIAVGGAITYLSEPEKEYEECLLKIQAQLNALNAIMKN